MPLYEASSLLYSHSLLLFAQICCVNGYCSLETVYIFAIASVEDLLIRLANRAHFNAEMYTKSENTEHTIVNKKALLSLYERGFGQAWVFSNRCCLFNAVGRASPTSFLIQLFSGGVFGHVYCHKCYIPLLYIIFTSRLLGMLLLVLSVCLEKTIKQNFNSSDSRCYMARSSRLCIHQRF